MKVIITGEATVYYKKEIEISQEEYNQIVDDVDNFGSDIFSDLLDIDLMSKDCQYFEWRYAEIEENKEQDND